MPRRSATLLASLIVLVVLICAAFITPVPYSEMGPGPTVNVLGKHDGDAVLEIEGHRTYPTSGHLNMTTVQVTGKDYRMNLMGAVKGWLREDRSVVPTDVLYPPDKSAEEIDKDNEVDFDDSQEHAKVVALRELGIPVGTTVIVKTVFGGEPAEGKLKPGEEILEVDGVKVSEPDDVGKQVRKRKAGQTVVFTVTGKDGKKTSNTRREVPIKTVAAKDNGRAVVGIEPGSTHTFPFTIDIKLADVGGPSAGLMFSLGLIDKLSPGKLTGGAFVAGTGTIDDKGRVGEIGGIQMKTIAARRAGAGYFLTPAGNCPDAAKTKPDGLTLVKVGTIDEAMSALTKIRTKHADELPACKG
jgi:PDZ domain-containing protein